MKGHERVYRANINVVLIGKVLDRLTEKNIALLRLSALQSYRNETFGGKLSDGTIVNPRELVEQKILYDEKKRQGYNEQPFFRSRWIHLRIGKGIVPSDENGLEHSWLTNE